VRHTQRAIGGIPAGFPEILVNAEKLAPRLLFHSCVKSFLLIAVLSLTAALTARAQVSSEVLREMNLARTNPQGYARLLAQRCGTGDSDTANAIRFLENARPLPPLMASSGLGRGAMLHVSEQGSSGGRGHGNCFGRIGKFGQWVGSAGENIYYGKRDARGIVCALIIDKGVAGKGHRKNIFSGAYGVAGVAYGAHRTFGAMCVIDFAGRFIERGSTIASL
jgi:hypothetical protein